jgi:hypothetical protein
MVLAVAVFLLQVQPAYAICTSAEVALTSDRSADRSTSGDRTRTKTVDPTASVFSSASDASENASEESSSLSGAASVKMDSIYSDDKLGRPASTGVLLAQNSQSFSTIRISETDEKRYAIREAESAPARRNWLMLSIVEHSAATFDAYSTRQAVSRGAVEQDPLMRPFAHSPAIYAAIQVGPVLFDLLARHMQRSNYNFERRTWWVPQTASTGMSIFAGIHNLNLKERRQTVP